MKNGLETNSFEEMAYWKILLIQPCLAKDTIEAS